MFYLFHAIVYQSECVSLAQLPAWCPTHGAVPNPVEPYKVVPNKDEIQLELYGLRIEAANI